MARPHVKVYTRKGDDGTTGLLYGGRAGKDDAGPEAYGAVDEAVSALGLAAGREPSRTPSSHELLVRCSASCSSSAPNSRPRPRTGASSNPKSRS